MILNPVRPLSAYRLQRDELDARTKQRKAMLQNVIDLDWYTSQRRRGAIKLVANKRRNAARLLARKQALLAIRAYRIEHGEDGGEEEENQSEAEENQSEAEEHQGDEEEDSNDEEEDARGERGPRCCRRACCDGYPPAVVATIRALMSRLPHTDQRHFMGRRVRQPVLRNNRPVPKARSLCSLETPAAITAQEESWSSSQNHPTTKMIVLGLAGGAMQRVCVAFFVWALGVSRNKLYQPTMDQMGGLIVSPVKRLYGRLAPKRAMIQETLTYMGEHESIIMPQSGDRILEHPTKKRSVAYALHLMGRNGGEIPSDSYVRRVWLEDPVLKETVKTRRTVPFSTCDTCFQLDKKIDCIMDSREKVRLFDEKREHKMRVNAERAEYYKRAARATLFPDEYLSIIIDGADQAANALPHSYREPKDVSNLWKQPVHNMGAISHGRQAFCFLCNDSMQLGSNATIEVLWRVLLITLKQEGCLPPHLYLQLDNTARQCKSQYVKGFAATLVACGVFKKITITYLPVGHTHEDIDQMFSVFSKKLEVQDAYTREALATIIRTSMVEPRLKGAAHKFKHPIHVEMMDQIANYRDFARKSLRIPVGISWWYQFRFEMVDGEVALQCRKDTIDGAWGGICNDEMKDHLFTRPFKAGQVVRITPDVVMPPTLRADFLLGPKGETNHKIAHYVKDLALFTKVHPHHGLGTYFSYVLVDLQAEGRRSSISAKRDRCYGIP